MNDSFNKKKRWYPQQSQSVFYFFPKYITKLSAGNPLLNLLLTRPCTKDSQNLLFPNLLRNPLNLTWLCTKASQTGFLIGILLNLIWICTKISRNLLRQLLRNPVEPELPLYQSLPDLHRNLFRNPVEPDLILHPIQFDLTLHQSLPNFLRNLHNLFRNLIAPGPAPAPAQTTAILGWSPH